MNRDELTDKIGKIVQNPEFAGLVQELQGNGASAEASTQEMLSHLPEVLSLLEPILGNEGSGESPKKEIPRDEHPPAEHGLKKYDKARAEKLMTALKPYLKPERCEIIDKCLSVLQLTDVIGILQELDGGKSNHKT